MGGEREEERKSWRERKKDLDREFVKGRREREEYEERRERNCEREETKREKERSGMRGKEVKRKSEKS